MAKTFQTLWVSFDLQRQRHLRETDQKRETKQERVKNRGQGSEGIENLALKGPVSNISYMDNGK